MDRVGLPAAAPNEPTGKAAAIETDSRQARFTANKKVLMPKDMDDRAMILDEQVMVFIVMVSEMFKKKSLSIFREYGLTFSHYNVLRYLVSTKDGRDTVGNVSKQMLVTGANVTGLAKRMEKAGLIQRKNDAKDERLTILEITPSGQTSLEEIRRIQERHVSRYLQSFSGDDKEKMLSVLKHIVRRGKKVAANNGGSSSGKR
jgi:MarR family transcriptional regulator, 2-MHQ and catechol-resistance regulon repressor